ncbi:MAG: ABC transporter permease [Paraclostridium sp.]|uniref:ABC transporter permease n=1 Tax=Paraclostridium sp. TaxID=2023273 RepID=UPI003F3009B6
MLQNNNQAIIKKLSNRSFKINKIRNFVSILAIVLTTVLFTSLFTVGYSMMEAFNSYKFMEYGMINHVQMQAVNDKQIEKIKNDKSIDKNSIGIVKNIASVVNPEFSTQSINLAVYDEKSVENSTHTDMVEGELPKSKDEIVMPIALLDMLKLPHKIGTEINLVIPESKDGKLTGKRENYKFKLSGYFKYKVTTSMPLHDIYASEEFYNEFIKANTVEATCVNFDFISDKNLQTQFDKVLKEIQPYSEKASINPVYLDTQVTNISEVIKNVLPIVLIIGLILISGYLLIYNIFYISVVKDIKYYGLLKTIGTSPKQINKLLINQANRLCLIGIPIGLILGFGLGVIFVPLVGSTLEGLNRTSFEYFNPIIFIGATIFSYITVRLSCMKPAKVASSVSPIDAVRYSDKTTNNKRKSKKGKSGSKIHKMALSNMFRNKRKAFLVLISMSLSCIIFLAVSTIISSSSPERAAEGQLLDDIEIEHGLVDMAKYQEEVITPINEEFIRDIKKLDGVNSISEIYRDNGYIVYDGLLKEELLTQSISQEYVDRFRQGIDPREDAKKNKQVRVDLNGLSSGELMNNIIKINETSQFGEFNLLEGSIDLNKFNKGGYIIILGHQGSKIKVGDKVNLKYLNTTDIKDGYTENEFEVMAILGGAENFYMDLFVNENDFKNIVEKPYIKKLIIDVDDKNLEEVEKNIDKLTEEYNNPYVKTFSKQKYIDEAKSFQMTITIIGMSAVFIIGFIGVLNFINTMITSIISRRQEFAMIEAVGMTKKQLKKMLILEGLYYGIIITCINLTLGSLGTFIGFNIMKLRYSVYTYPVGALILCIVAVFLISLIVPLIVYKQVSKDSIVERIRVTE